MLQDLVRRTLCWKSFGFLSSDNKEKQNLSLPLKCPALSSPPGRKRQWQNDTKGSREEKTGTED